jgi:tetratricopeptide (TPR) repeat protein
MGLLRGSFQAFPRRKRIRELEGLLIDNPSIGNYEELGDLLLDEGQFARARECFDKVIAKSDSIDPFYRRALCALELDDFPAAAADLERVVARDPKYDYHRAKGFLALALAKTGDRERADKLFAEALELSTLSEIQYNYASFLSETGRAAEARELVEKILLKKKTMPDYIRRRERPWFRKANALLKTLPR